MVKRNDEETSGQSSVALLQQRFKRLQKIREMRKEKELLHIKSSAEIYYDQRRRYVYHNHHHVYSCMQPLQSSESSSNSSNSEPIMSRHRPPLMSSNSTRLSLSLWSESTMMKPADPTVSESGNGIEGPPRLWHLGASLGFSSTSSSCKFDDPVFDVDTSLRL